MTHHLDIEITAVAPLLWALLFVAAAAIWLDQRGGRVTRPIFPKPSQLKGEFL